MPGPFMSQPLPSFPLQHAMSMPMPLGHAGAALPVFQHGFEFAPPMGHGGGASFYGGGAPRNGSGGYGSSGGGGGAMSRAVSAPERVQASGGAGSGRLSRFAPPGSSVEAH